MITEQPVGYIERLTQLAGDLHDEVAYVHLAMDGSERTVTWRQLDERSSQVAAAFQARGVGFGDLVGLGIRNSPELVFAVLAAWKLGAVPVPVRWDVPDWELDRLKRAIAPRIYVSADDLGWLTATEGDPVPTFPAVISPNVSGICSSGSTGTPKVILNTRPGEWFPELSTPFAENFGLLVSRPQTILVPAPMYHTNGFMTLNSMLGGDCLVVLEKFDAALMVDTIERFAVTTFTATPTMLQRVAALPGIESRNLSTVEWILQGAATMPPGLLRTWFELLDGPEKVVMAYGMTEQLGLTALTGTEWLTHEGSVGRGFRDTEVRILDEQQKPVPIGDFGDVYMRAPATGSYSYLGGAPLLPMTADGFGTAGDIGRLDDEGYLYLADRRVDMIVTGGANVFPAEVESVLAEHPGIADAVVIGLSDPGWGRRVHAIVERMPGAEALAETDVIGFVKDRLASYKAPKTVEFVAQLPRSAATKISRSALVQERGG
ncbi:MAG TPA: AMP-binding protein [Pseudonocardiaceae bacterium]|nr:AMP-binding protein [Pseudonocardiaceae bacterium]